LKKNRILSINVSIQYNILVQMILDSTKVTKSIKKSFKKLSRLATDPVLMNANHTT